MTNPAGSPRYSVVSPPGFQSPAEWSAPVMVTLISPNANVPPLFIPVVASDPPGSRRASQRLISWMHGQVGRSRLASATASPMWSPWPCVTRRRSQAVTASAAFGLFGFPNHGSIRIVFPPGVRTSTQAWPYQVIVVAGSSPIRGTSGSNLSRALEPARTAMARRGPPRDSTVWLGNGRQVKRDSKLVRRRRPARGDRIGLVPVHVVVGPRRGRHRGAERDISQVVDREHPASEGLVVAVPRDPLHGPDERQLGSGARLGPTLCVHERARRRGPRCQRPPVRLVKGRRGIDIGCGEL